MRDKPEKVSQAFTSRKVKEKFLLQNKSKVPGILHPLIQRSQHDIYWFSWFVKPVHFIASSSALIHNLGGMKD